MGTTKSKGSTRKIIIRADHVLRTVLGELMMVISVVKAIGPLNEDGDNHPSENEDNHPERKGLMFGKANTFLSCCQLIALHGHRNKGSVVFDTFPRICRSFVCIYLPCTDLATD